VNREQGGCAAEKTKIILATDGHRWGFNAKIGKTYLVRGKGIEAIAVRARRASARLFYIMMERSVLHG